VGWNKNFGMSGTQAAICVDGELELYYANSYDSPSIIPNYLQKVQCVRTNNDITFNFQRKFQEAESTVDFSKAFYFVGAYTTGNSFSKHTDKESKYMGVNGISTPAPTLSPTNAPTNAPTNDVVITLSPTDAPTLSPTNSPTNAPTNEAVITLSPTNSPTLSPTNAPTLSNPADTLSPTNSPTTSTPTESPNSGLKEYSLSINTMQKVSCQAKWYEEPNPLVSFEVVCSSPNWCGLGMNSKTAAMSGMEAAICVNQDVKLYQTSGHFTPYNVGLNQYLSSVNCMQNSTTTVMKFSRRFSIPLESSNSNTVQFSGDSYVFFLSAYGFGPTLQLMHAEKSYTFAKFSQPETNSPTIFQPEQTKSPTSAFTLNPTAQVGQVSENTESGSKTALIAVSASIIAIISASLTIMWLRKKKTINHLSTRRTADIVENRLSAGTGDHYTKDAIAL
jgi:hypothetical protein